MFKVNYKKLEEEMLARLMADREPFRFPLDYDLHKLSKLELELRRQLLIYGNASAEVSATGRVVVHDPPVYVQAGDRWVRVPRD